MTGDADPVSSIVDKYPDKPRDEAGDKFGAAFRPDSMLATSLSPAGLSTADQRFPQAGDSVQNLSLTQEEARFGWRHGLFKPG